MHTLLVGVSLLVVVASSLALRSILDQIHAWQLRRWLQVSVLCLPTFVIAVGFSGLHHLLGAWCPLPTWDVLFGIIGPLLIAATACGAWGRSIFHFFRVRRQVALLGQPAPGNLQRQLEELAMQRGVHCPRLFVCSLSYPVALTYGVKQPVILLSSWMLTNLDRQELTGVLAHELEHVVRQDYLLLFLTTLLRDAFFYLPLQRATYQQMRQEKELACDEQATLATRRPLALASALLKVNLYAAENHSLSGISKTLPSFAERTTITEQRLAQLYAWRTRLRSQDDLVHWQQGKQLPIMWQVSLLFFFVLLGATINLLVFYGLQCAFT